MHFFGHVIPVISVQTKRLKTISVIFRVGFDSLAKYIPSKRCLIMGKHKLFYMRNHIIN